MVMGKPKDDMAINRAFEVVFEVVKPVRCTNDGCPFANYGISQADAIGCCAILNLLLHRFCASHGTHHLHIDAAMLAIMLTDAVCLGSDGASCVRYRKALR